MSCTDCMEPGGCGQSVQSLTATPQAGVRVKSNPMAQTRREKTLADYVVIAISPALIMALVGSLVFFLLEVVYRGDHPSRILWVLTCYVFGAVLVARIGIEQGKDRAQLFGAALLVAAGVFAFRFVDAFLISCGLLAVIAWCTWRLTWDCTLIDDEEDASGQGLLQAAGLQHSPPAAIEIVATGTGTAGTQASVESLPKDSAATSPRRSGRAGVANSLVDAEVLSEGIRAPVPQVFASTSAQAASAAERGEKLDERAQKQRSEPHAPGVWVVYFSLAALPLFGVGQLLIPAGDASRRNYAFQLLALYVAAALGLLLTTSFLGLRRYLRQRKLQMPAAMTRSWLGMGATLAVAVLLVAALVPRPQGEYTVTDLVDQLDKQVAASRVAVLGGDHGQGEGRRMGDVQPNAPPGEGGGKQKPEPGGNKAAEKGAEQQPDNQAGQPKGGQEPGGQGAAGQNPGTAPGQEKSGDKSGGQGPKGDGSSPSNSPPSGDQKSQKQPGGEQQTQGNDAREPSANNKSPSQPKDGGSGGKSGDAKQAPDAGKQQQQQQQQRQGDPGTGRPADVPRDTPSDPGKSPWSTITNALSQFGGWVKWLFYVIVAVVGLYFLFRNWSAVVTFLSRLWAELLGLFGWKSVSAESASAESAVQKSVDRPFSAFDNPFANGTARRMKLPQLLDYSFQALEAWAREKRVPRSLDQTPWEFAEALGERIPDIEQDASKTAQLYAQVAYAKKSPGGESLDVLERLWRRMDAGAAA